jgi:hypothetical protein
MATVTVGTTPVELDDGSHETINVGNTGQVRATLTIGSRTEVFDPGFSRPIHTGGLAVTAATALGTTTLVVDTTGVAPTPGTGVDQGDLDAAVAALEADIAAAQAASLQKASNLADVANAGTARTNLGLGTAATMTPSSLADDGAFTDSFAPLFAENDVRRYIDGVVSDATALINALTAVGSGGEVLVPAGVTLALGASNVTVNGRTIRGPGKITGTGGTVLTLAGASPRLIGLSVQGDGTQVLNVAGNCTGLDIQECVIGSANGTSTPTGIQMNATGIANARVRGNHFDRVAYGVLTNAAATDLTNLRIAGNTFRNVFSDPIELNHPGTAYTGAHNVRVYGNDITASQGSSGSSGFGVGIAGAVGVSVIGNTFGYCRQQAVHIEDEAKHIIVSGNTFLQPVDAIKVFGGDWITISDNEIYAPTGYGIHFVQDVSNQPTHWAIHGNGVYQAGATGIYINADNPHYGLLIDNRVDGCVGSNIVYRGTSTGVLYGPARIEGNLSSNSGGYGMELIGHIGSHVGYNLFRGNTSGDYLRQTSTPAVRIPINSPTGEGVGTSTSNLTDWVNILDVGERAAGILTVNAIRSNNAGMRCQLIAQMDWDGTVLTVTPVGSEIAASGISGLTFQVVSGRLQVRASITGADGQTVRFWGALMGTVLI